MPLFQSKVIGIYGVSGCGKSYELDRIQNIRPEWRCLDGSSILRETVEEHGYSWSDFQKMNETEKGEFRQDATRKIRAYQGVTLIAGHACFPRGAEFVNVFTEADGTAYDNILLMADKSPSKIAENRRNDGNRERPDLSEEAIAQWVDHERDVLEEKCEEFGISACGCFAVGWHTART